MNTWPERSKQLSNLIRDLLIEGVRTGDVRDDVAPEERASSFLHALAAASTLPSRAAVRRLVAVTQAGVATPALTLSERTLDGRKLSSMS